MGGWVGRMGGWVGGWVGEGWARGGRGVGEAWAYYFLQHKYFP
jgi:hypothetical protein